MSELSPEARALLARVGEGDGPNAARRARVKRQLAARLAASGLAVGVTQAATAGTSHAAGGALAGAGLGKAAVSATSVALWLAGGALAGSVVMLPVTLLQESAEPRPAQTRAALSATAPALAPNSPARVASPLVDSAKLPKASEAEAPLEPQPSRNREGLAVAARVSAVPSSGGVSAPASLGLQGEMRLLEAAQAELASGRGERALELLSRHEREFPDAALGEERAFARVIALCQLGRSTEARAAADAFLRAAPRSPLVLRLRKSCAFSADPPEGEKR